MKPYQTNSRKISFMLADVDGALVTNDKLVTARTRAAVADLRAAQIAEHLCGDLDLRQRLGVVRDLVTVDVQHRCELDVAVFVGRDAVEDDDGADLHLLLAAAGAHDCVNHGIS